ncbi:glutaredoxin family protein [Cellulomonas cellasea]|uniref:Glutaredoxin-like protein NrdH n=1 Tax=Cellulomonas cellasea TaxID=43670 RepID=A0A7W4UBT0_9CELL|nr:glutaredoxin family protein [Cellulomonas cellasea]MBB2921301.1 glutaredoxin-like protein NrdH [Cellulomonas cellasea]
METTTAKVTVYTRKGCGACMATFRALTKAGISYEAIDTTCNKTLEDELRASGALQMPVVVTPIGRWDGFRDDRIRDLRDHLAQQASA